VDAGGATGVINVAKVLHMLHAAAVAGSAKVNNFNHLINVAVLAVSLLV
jgi:hypothetical protein